MNEKEKELTEALASLLRICKSIKLQNENELYMQQMQRAEMLVKETTNQSNNPLKIAMDIYEQHLELTQENGCDGYKDVAMKSARITIVTAQSFPLSNQSFWDNVLFELDNLL